jgi:sugar phosphate isomerase/epimerase
VQSSAACTGWPSDWKRSRRTTHQPVTSPVFSAPTSSSAAILVGCERSLETAQLLGHEYLIVPDLTPETQRSLDDWRERADRFNAAGAVARRAGIWLAFHNESDHLKPIGGRVPYDVFVDRLDPSLVRLQLDVGNLMLGGGDPLRYLERYRDRYWSFHLKDVVAYRSRDTELGSGVVDFKRLLGAIPALTAKPCYVEQEAWECRLVARCPADSVHNTHRTLPGPRDQ